MPNSSTAPIPSASSSRHSATARSTEYRLDDVAAVDDEQRLDEPGTVHVRFAHERTHRSVHAQAARPRDDPAPFCDVHPRFSSTYSVTLWTNAPTSAEDATMSGVQPRSTADFDAEPSIAATGGRCPADASERR
jgi:hypothetical protein